MLLSINNSNKFSISLNFSQSIPETLNTHFPGWMPRGRQPPRFLECLLGYVNASVPEYCRNLKGAQTQGIRLSYRFKHHYASELPNSSHLIFGAWIEEVFLVYPPLGVEWRVQQVVSCCQISIVGAVTDPLDAWCGQIHTHTWDSKGRHI